MYIEVEGLVPELEKLLAEGNTDRFLLRLAAVTKTVAFSMKLEGKVLYLPSLDQLLRRIAEERVPRPSRPAVKDQVVHVLTEAYTYGGHTRVMEDIVAALPELKHTLIITDIATAFARGDLKLGHLEERYRELGLDVIILDPTDLAGKLDQLIRLIDDLAPHTIFVNANHHDSIIYAGICGHSAPRVHFLHHADHAPSLGSTRGDYEHLDLTPVCHQHCIEWGATTPKMLNMTVADQGVLPFGRPGPLVGSTCASSRKYFGDSLFSYPQLLAALFAAGMDKMVHIGDVEPPLKEKIRRELAQAGQSPDKLEFYGAVPSLAAALKDIAPSFYMNSHPVGGGKAVIEAMSMGLPVVHPCPSTSPPLTNPDMSFGLALKIAELSDAASVVATLKQNDGADLARASRECYEARYSPQVFRASLLEATS